MQISPVENGYVISVGGGYDLCGISGPTWIAKDRTELTVILAQALDASEALMQAYEQQCGELGLLAEPGAPLAK